MVGCQRTAGRQQFTTSRSHGSERVPKSVNIFLGCFFLVNYFLGNGYLSLSYSFLYAGYLAAIPTLLLITFMSTITAMWEVEVMARAQALESFTNFWKSFGAANSGDFGNDDKKVESFVHDESGKYSDYNYRHPDFRVLLARKFELSELCEVFFNKWGKYLYLLIVTVVCFLIAWSLAIVVGTAWATNIPFNFGPFRQCSYDAFNNKIIPHGPDLECCLFAYYCSLMLFALIVVPLSVMGLKEQVIIQMILGLLRILLLSMMLIYCLVRLIQGDIELQENLSSQVSNSSLGENGSNMTKGTVPLCYLESNSSLGENGSKMTNVIVPPCYLELYDIAVKFNWRGWLTTISVVTFAYTVHHSIPTLTHPIREKKYLRQFIVCAFCFVGLCYLSLGVVVPLWFRTKTQEVATLSWGELTKPDRPTYLRVISYCIILIPSLQVCSVYPLNIHPLVNNIYTVFVGHDTTKMPKERVYLLRLLMLRFFAAVIPIMCAFLVSNLVYVFQYCGIFSFSIIIFFPTALQLQSIRVCKKRFHDIHVRMHMTRKNSSASHDSGEPCDNSDDTGLTGVHNTEVVLHSLQLTQPQNESSLYMTPYSSRVFSHPIAVSIIGSMGGLLFLLSIVSLSFPLSEQDLCRMQ